MEQTFSPAGTGGEERDGVCHFELPKSGLMEWLGLPPNPQRLSRKEVSEELYELN